MSTSVQLRDPRSDVDSACLGGVYSDSGMSPVTNVGIYTGSVENQLFFVFDAKNNWTDSQFGARASVSIDGSITACAISVDGTVTACALAPSDEGSEVHVVKTPSSPTMDPLSSIKIFETSMFPIRSICFGMNGKLKTRIIIGCDDGTINSVSLSSGRGQA